MSKKEIKSMYESMRELGELTFFMPSATEDWEKDKNQFVKLYNQNANLEMDLKPFSIDDLNTEDEEF